jgi:hypothetical protein
VIEVDACASCSIVVKSCPRSPFGLDQVDFDVARAEESIVEMFT